MHYYDTFLFFLVISQQLYVHLRCLFLVNFFCRLAPATEPHPPEAPEIADVSDTEVLLKWKQPKDDGNSPVLCYGLQYQENGNCLHIRNVFRKIIST